MQHPVLTADRVDELLENGQVADGHQNGAEPSANLRRQLALPVRDREFGHGGLPLSDGDAAFPSKQVERPLHAEHQLIVGPCRLAAQLQRQRQISVQARLILHTASDVHGGPRRAHRRRFRERPSDRLLDGHAVPRIEEGQCGATARRCLCPCRWREEPGRDEESHNRSSVHCTLPWKFTDPWPAGPSQSIAICQAPAIPNSAAAAYWPGTPLGVICRPLDITIPGMAMFPLARTAPTSTSEPLSG